MSIVIDLLFKELVDSDTLLAEEDLLKPDPASLRSKSNAYSVNEVTLTFCVSRRLWCVKGWKEKSLQELVSPTGQLEVPFYILE